MNFADFGQTDQYAGPVLVPQAAFHVVAAVESRTESRVDFHLLPRVGEKGVEFFLRQILEHNAPSFGCPFFCFTGWFL